MKQLVCMETFVVSNLKKSENAYNLPMQVTPIKVQLVHKFTIHYVAVFDQILSQQEVKLKVKQSHYKPRQALRVLGG
jgi:uncharacterized OB-fold protein